MSRRQAGKPTGSADPEGAAGPESEALSRTFQKLSHQGHWWGGGSGGEAPPTVREVCSQLDTLTMDHPETQ